MDVRGKRTREINNEENGFFRLWRTNKTNDFSRKKIFLSNRNRESKEIGFGVSDFTKPVVASFRHRTESRPPTNSLSQSQAHIKSLDFRNLRNSFDSKNQSSFSTQKFLNEQFRFPKLEVVAKFNENLKKRPFVVNFTKNKEQQILRFPASYKITAHNRNFTDFYTSTKKSEYEQKENRGTPVFKKLLSSETEERQSSVQSIDEEEVNTKIIDKAQDFFSKISSGLLAGSSLIKARQPISSKMPTRSERRTIFCISQKNLYHPEVEAKAVLKMQRTRSGMGRTFQPTNTPVRIYVDEKAKAAKSYWMKSINDLLAQKTIGKINVSYYKFYKIDAARSEGWDECEVLVRLVGEDIKHEAYEFGK